MRKIGRITNQIEFVPLKFEPKNIPRIKTKSPTIINVKAIPPVLYAFVVESPSFPAPDKTASSLNLTINKKGKASLNIFVKYAVITGNLSDVSNVTSFIDYICSQRPDLCTPQIIYRSAANASEAEGSFNVTQEQWNAFVLSFIEWVESEKVQASREREDNHEIKSLLNSSTSKTSSLESNLTQWKLQSDTNSRNMFLFLLTIMLILCVSLSIYLVYYLRNQKRKWEFETT